MTWEATISVEAVRYSVPDELTDTRVWARFHGDELIVTTVDDDGAAPEVARHPRGQPGSPVLEEAHYEPRWLAHQLPWLLECHPSWSSKVRRPAPRARRSACGGGPTPCFQVDVVVESALADQAHGEGADVHGADAE